LKRAKRKYQDSESMRSFLSKEIKLKFDERKDNIIDKYVNLKEKY
jgi:hypothetical protein